MYFRCGEWEVANCRDSCYTVFGVKHIMRFAVSFKIL